MFKFFRRVRHKLLAENKFTRYLLYGIGEIVLVVIGILIALNINNRNEYRKERVVEHNMVLALYNEIGQNEEYTQEFLSSYENRSDATRQLLSYISSDMVEIENEHLDNLLLDIFVSQAYSPRMANVERVLSSDKLDLIKVQELKEALILYKSVLDVGHIEAESARNHFSNIVMPYVIKKYPLRDIIVNYPGFDLGESKAEVDPAVLLGDLELENLLILILADSGIIIQIANQNLQDMRFIKELIETHYSTASE